MGQIFTVIPTKKTLDLTSTSSAITVPVSRNDSLVTNVLNAQTSMAIITTLVVSSGAVEIGVYKGDPATASNKIGRIRIGANRFAVGNIILGEAIATPSASSSSPLGYGTAFEPVTGPFDDTNDARFKVDTASAGGGAAGVAEIYASLAIREG